MSFTLFIIFFVMTTTVMSYPTPSSSSDSEKDLYLCLHNCALCVRQWEPGLYNGEKCARKCMKMRTTPRIVDPDCNSLKMFNYRAIKKRRSDAIELST